MIHREDHIQAFRDAMASEGIVYSGPIDADGKLHRFQVDDDPKGKKNGWYSLHIDERPAGMFGCNKRLGDKKMTWTAKGLTPLTDEERRELARRSAEAKAKAIADEAARHAEAAKFSNACWDAAKDAERHPYLAKKQVQPHGTRVGLWKKPRPDGTYYTVATDALLVPMRDEKKVIWGVQAIFAAPVMMGGEERGKDFAYGARKRGVWFAIGKPTVIDGELTVLLCEGFATGASLHEATGAAVLVCFDRNNLLHVARKARAMLPNARLVICGDEDQFTIVRGVPENPGRIAALDAARTVKGIAVLPQFSNVNSKPTDFNDLHVLDGLDAVKRQVFAAWGAVIEPPPAAEPDEAPPWHDEAPEGPGEHDGSHLPAVQDEASAPADNSPKAKKKRNKKDENAEPFDPDALHHNGWFRILGHDRDMIYIFQSEMKMVIARKNTDWGRNAFLTLANMSWWEQNFPGGGKEGFDTAMAANAMIRIAFEKGYYDPTRTRGRGAWRDGGRFIFHFGGKLLIDGQETEVTDIRSSYVYEQGRHLNLPSETPLSAQDGVKIIQVAQAFHWARPASAILLAGWVALAPICGALRWRPHIWITGGTGSGKSTVLNEFVWFLMDGLEVYAQGNSTEAGIRQTLESDALPVLFDESEQNDERERFRVQSILALIRQASTESGARTLKGTQFGSAQGFMIRSMFCLASVQVGMRHQADSERISVLSLRPKRVEDKDQAAKNWAAIKGAVDSIKSDDDLPGRLLRRSIQLLPITIQNIETFAKVAADKFGSQREGDQYGAMLAGAWSLVKSGLATEQDAKDMIGKYDWTEYLEGSETEESTKALNAVLERMIRTQKGDVSVYELVACAAGRKGEGAWDGNEDTAVAHLARHGIKINWVTTHVRDAALLFANNSTALAELMEGTPYASDVKGQLARVPGAFRADATRFNGIVSRAVGIPLLAVLDGVKGEVPDPFGDEIPF